METALLYQLTCNIEEQLLSKIKVWAAFEYLSILIGISVINLLLHQEITILPYVFDNLFLYISRDRRNCIVASVERKTYQRSKFGLLAKSQEFLQ